jgi:hypothetical protein
VRVERSGEIQVSPQDDHVAHIQGHTALLDHPGLREAGRTALRAHIQDHVSFAIAAEVRALQEAIGTLAGPGMMPGGGPPPLGGPGPGPPGVPPLGGGGLPPGGPPPAPPGPGGPVLPVPGPLGAPAARLAGVPRRGGGGAAAAMLGLRPPAPLGQGRVGKTRDLGDLFRRLPRLPRL